MRYLLALLAALGGLVFLLALYAGLPSSSLGREYRRALDALDEDPRDSTLLLETDADFQRLPPLVQRYLRVSGAVGAPRIHNFRVQMHGEIRSGPKDPWMSFVAEQVNTVPEPRRLFFMRARMRGLPTEVYHRFVGPSATMRVRVLRLFTVVDAKGPEMDIAETVTLLNDLCIMAPGALVSSAIAWEPVDSTHVRATFTHAGRSVSAVLSFGAGGDLVDFFSSDRLRLAADGNRHQAAGWSTPLSDHRAFGRFRLGARGEGLWTLGDQTFAYIRLTIDSVTYNVPPTRH